MFLFQLAKLGFTNIDALDPSDGMLEEAQKKNVYKNFLCQYFDINSDIAEGRHTLFIHLSFPELV